MVGFYSCSSDDDDKTGTEGNESAIVGKWEVSNQNAAYGSFEFTSDKKYIITQRTTTPPNGSRSVTRAGETYIIVIFGDYSSLSGTGNEYTLNLKEFGTIVINISGSGATITVNGETYDTNKAPEITTNKSKTELLCHEWKFDKSIINGEELPSEYSYYRLVFTETGTYYSEGTFREEPIESFSTYGAWEWVDSKTIKITQEGGTNTWEEETLEETFVSTVQKLTDSELVIYGIDNSYEYEETTTYLYR
ncbi:hypothetical protein D0T85_05935 [Bacteroides sp. 519]|nr:hypothetical protein [Bacteroides sp. 519]